MAQLFRSPKSASDWTDHDLKSYNIGILTCTPEEFFPAGPDPSLDHLDPAILNSPLGLTDRICSSEAATYLDAIDLAVKIPQERQVDGFVTETLRVLGFDNPPASITSGYITPLTICGETRKAQTDICAIHVPTLILLVLVENKTLHNNRDPEAQVIAEAIAAFQHNNDRRTELNLGALDTMTIPCITLSGTRPTFYLVPVTTELSEAVGDGRPSLIRTSVLRCSTGVRRARRSSTGMADIDYRKLALRHFLAFKGLAKSHWVKVLEGIV